LFYSIEHSGDALTMRSEKEPDKLWGVIAFRAPPGLIADLESAAALEGISKSDVARRALLRDIARSRREEGARLVQMHYVT
jgi:hypothetical protein